MAQLVVDTNSWVSVSEADDYMDSRYGSWEFWDDDTNKPAALVTAYKTIVNSGMFEDLPSVSTQKMKDAQCEMALFIVAEGGDVIRRKALQSQGVISAGVVKETYDKDKAGKVAFPPEVLNLLEEYMNDTNAGVYIDDLSRDDTKDVI